MEANIKETMTTSNSNAQLDGIFRSPCIMAHVAALITDATAYIAALDLLLDSGTFPTAPSGVRTSMMVALHTMSQGKTLTRVMRHCEVSEILKALTMMDDRRLSRQLVRKVQKIENDHPHLISLPGDESEDESETNVSKSDCGRKRKSRRKVDVYRRKLRSIIANLEESCPDKTNCNSEAHANTAVQEMIQSAPGVSGALSQKVRDWAKSTLTADALEYIMLMNAKTPWRILANLVHFSPSDFAVPYFLADVHDEPIPETSFVARMRALVAKYTDDEGNDTIVKEFDSLAEEFPQVSLAFPFLRLHSIFMMQSEIVEKLATHVPLETVVWNFEELHRTSSKCQSIVLDRLRKQDFSSGSGNVKATTYGKLMERILTFQRMGLDDLAKAVLTLADGRLEELKSYWAERAAGRKVAVIGDASASMQVAIESATIFASLVSVCFDGELSFYNTQPIASPFEKPRNVKEALVVCKKIRASGCTSPAAALWKYVEKKQWIDLFVHVTDQYENTQFKGESHASLLARYKTEVNPNVEVVIVCVGRGNRSFRQEMESRDIDYRVVIIDEYRPDLAKFDSLLGQLVTMRSVDSSSEDDQDEFVVV